METSDSPRYRLIPGLVFVGCFGFLLQRLIGYWAEMDTGERCVRGLELMFIILGAWVVVAPDYFPSWRPTKEPSSFQENGFHLEESRTPRQE